MLTNAEINPPSADGAEILSPPMVHPQDSPSLAPSYRDRLNRWAIARLEAETKVTVARFRSYSDAEGHLKFLRQQFPLEKFVIIAEKG